ncbi:hypothetical protein P280DRAFT_468143 [Massarina eburnea CBS 473.64]|uniref:SNF2 family helicase/ATPase-like protein n=1 Tax=Massarina eburnea CBS 473.64 TaxID=1395130 RepID=A0A6A6S6L2_9PLEO|nr:hypothetical protein P280DRAFT_468143 [Massarina eburnea CBS 473.64]
MNSGPRKHRTAFRPLDTLSSSQKLHSAASLDGNTCTHRPSLDGEESSYLPYLPEGHSTGSFAYPPSDRSEIEFLGDSSSLFIEDGASLLRSTPQHTPNPPRTTTKATKMVRERDPPAQQPRAQQPPSKTPSKTPSKPLQELVNTAPEFGQASPLRNPLKKDVHKNTSHAGVFNVPRPGHARPEHHRDSNPIALQHAPTNKVPTNNLVGSRYSSASADSDVFEIPSTQFQSRQPSHGVPVPMPHNAPLQPIKPPPRPMYSSMGHTDGFQPVNHAYTNPFHGSRKTVILDDIQPKRSANNDDDEDDFDPDAEIRATDQFGAPDMQAYVDGGRANENIKALLEGAFDEDKIPRTRGRKKRKQQEDDEVGKSLADRLKALEVKDEPEAPEEEEDEAEDDGTVDGMKVKLLPHQVEGVAWLIEKETGAHNKRAKLPKGGILADDMGLGKTVQAMALILSNPRPEKGVEPENKKNKILPTVGKGTLVVAPLALIKQWEAEIKDKVAKSHSLSVLVHHGPSRTKSIDKLKQYDVVITTYQVLASEHKTCGEGPDGLKKGCFGVHWYRVMLDEAHTIKNRNAQMTKACYDLKSHYRWCLTGTPMQNNLDELQSLIKFLRIKPYCDVPEWKVSITGPMKNGKGNLAMRRLQIFLKACMKRRTKDVLKKDGALNFGGKAKEGEKKAGFQIVARNIENIIGEFTAKERQFYERLSSRAETRLAEMMGDKKQDVIGALVLLLRLRQACNHPQLIKSNMKDDNDALTTGSKSNTQSEFQTPRKSKDADADDLADLLGGLTVQTKRCDVCQSKLTRENADAGAIRCNDCEEDLGASVTKPKKSKKHRKHDRKDRKDKKDKKHRKSNKASEDEPEPEAPKASRNRRVVIDSDDEEEAEGEWLVSGDERDTAGLGKAGGTDDENADGDADTLNTVDSDSDASEDEGTVGSFVVHDTDSEDEEPVARKKQSKKPKVVSLVSDDESASDSEADSEESDDDSEADSEEDSETEDEDPVYDVSEFTPSTKIRQLLTILEKETPDHKVIVFSQFTSMLDLVGPFLKRAGYNFTRYDGKMRNDLREASLEKLRNDKRTRVLLCSLKCGSLGLNLTCASRVVIMEPFWNPFVEEQAIDRVHRLNQTVDVTVYRLSIHNSVEEKILDLQEAKRKLAAAAIEGGKAIGKLDMKDILALFKHDAEYTSANVDADSDAQLYTKTRVLEEKGNDPGAESTERKKGRKAGSLGFKRQEDSVWGRR